MQSRYYNPEIGRFINADGLVTTGQGLLGNNMFAYCLNNPIMFGDSNGCKAGCSACDMRLYCDRDDCPYKIMDKWREKGVEYVSNGKGKGGKIINSYLITDREEMCKYIDYLINKSPYRDDFLGSVEGVLYEWDIHNKIYYYGPKRWEVSAKDVDLGRAIFDDPHEGLNKIMWWGYFLTFPEAYLSDLSKLKLEMESLL